MPSLYQSEPSRLFLCLPLETFTKLSTLPAGAAAGVQIAGTVSASGAGAASASGAGVASAATSGSSDWTGAEAPWKPTGSEDLVFWPLQDLVWVSVEGTSETVVSER